MNILFLQNNIGFISNIGLLQISAIAKSIGCNCYFGSLRDNQYGYYIEKYSPDIVVYSASTGEHKEYARINKEIKEKYPKIVTIIGGHHATFFPDVLYEGNFDAVCIGEGEIAFKEFIQAVKDNKSIDNINNIKTKINITPKLNPLLQNLDELPFMDTSLVYDNKKQYYIMTFITSRGCPYNCSYCFNHFFNALYHGQKIFRYHSVDYIINQILLAKSKHKFKFIRFVDDLFLLKPEEWIREFSSKYEELIRLPFYIHSRFEYITEEKIRLLKKAGCVTIQMSIESTNDKIRKEVLNRVFSEEAMHKALEICSKYNITVLTYTMLGLPTSTIKDDIDAVNYNSELNLKYHNVVSEFPIFQPYPNTAIEKLCKERGYYDGDANAVETNGNFKGSLLNCFNDNEKRIQANLHNLGLTAVRIPFLRKVILDRMIYGKSKWIYKQIQIITRLLTYPNTVYKRDYSFAERIALFIKGFLTESIRRGS